MKFNFRKIASVLASAIMIGSTAGTALAANYPAPFIVGGTADAAIVITSGSHAGALMDYDAAIALQKNLQSLVVTTAASTTATVTGEAAPLGTSSTRLYMNDSLSAVKSVLTSAELPTVLKAGSFSGNVDATYTQTIDIGANPQLTYAKQPTSSDDPTYGLTLGTNANTQYIYNASLTFNKAVALNDSNSEGQDITMFGQKFTISAATDNTNLVLLKSAEKVSLTSDAPSQEVTVSGKKYTVELVSASDTAATVKVTDESGNTETKEVTENNSKKIQGITIAVTNADETNFKLSASIIAGADKVTLTNGSSVTYGEDAKVVDGTQVSFLGGIGAITKITISVAAANSDKEAINPGQSFTDPVYGSFKLDFAGGLNIPENSTLREEFTFTSSGDDKMLLKMTDHRLKEKSFQWAKNTTIDLQLMADNDGRNITVFERGVLYRNEYVVVGNEAEGYLLKLSQVANQTTGYDQDKIQFTDVFSDGTYEATLTAEGAGTLTVGGKVYGVVYNGANSVSEDTRTVRLNYPDSSGADTAVIYPTIKSSKGAKVALYEPTTIDFGNWDGANAAIATLKFPDGDGYTDVAITKRGEDNWTVGSASGYINTSATVGTISVTVAVGTLTYNFTSSGTVNQSVVYLKSPEGANIVNPAVVIFEEKDDNTLYQAMIVTLEPGTTSEDGLGIDEVKRTWHADATWEAITMSSDSKKTKEADLYGAIITVDGSDSDQKKATISYPDEQVYANMYVSATAAVVSSSTAGGGGGQVLIVKDSEVDSVKDSNLIVVGGSCINTVALKIIDATATAPICGEDFTAKTTVDAGKRLIKAVASPYNTAKTAVLVAGYEAADTKLAAEDLKASAKVDVGTTTVNPVVTTTA